MMLTDVTAICPFYHKAKITVYTLQSTAAAVAYVTPHFIDPAGNVADMPVAGHSYGL